MNALLSMRTLVVAVLTLFFAATNSRGFYNPTQGRWLSRDPIAERGGINSFAFVENVPVSRVDLLGRSSVNAPPPIMIVDIRHHSQGYAFRDPFYFTVWSETESGEQDSASASFSQTVWSIYNPGGICNSGDFICTYLPFVDDPINTAGTSYVRAWAENKGKCCARLRYTCSFEASAQIYFAATETRPLMNGHLLGETVPAEAHEYAVTEIRFFDWAAFNTEVTVSGTQTKEINLYPSQPTDLYHLNMSVAPQTTGIPFLTGFTEQNTASCSFEFVGACK